jgi:ribonucleotide monophosphatase NagD (HAD superfamily)
MVGDDIRTDIVAGGRVGLRGVFVLSGKHDLTDIETIARGRGGRVPDGIAPTLREVVAALG